MKQKVYKLGVIALLLYLPIIGKAVTVTDSAVAANVQVCLKKEVVRLAFSVGSSGTTGSYLDIKLPTGFSWEGIAYGPIVAGGSGSNTITYAGVFSGKHRITFGSSTQNQSIRLGFYQKAGCGAGTSSFTTRDSLFFYEGTGSINLSATDLFNGVVPSLSLTSISNSPSPTTVGATVTRKYTITNGGFGATSNFNVIDDYLNGGLLMNLTSFKINPSGVNYTIPSGNITDNLDSTILRFRPTLIQQIGDGDTLFENGESFELQYTFTTSSCGDGSNNIISNLNTTWLCNGSFCTYISTPTAVSITVPSAPNLIKVSKAAVTWCTNSNSIDTFFVTNSGGAARDLIFTIASQLWPENQNIGLNSYTGYLDTANFFIKLGSNGAKIHPTFSVLNYTSHNMAGVVFGNEPAVIEYKRLFLNSNDTLWFFVSQKYVTASFDCGNQSSFGTFRPAYPGILYDLTYNNACGNISYSEPRVVVRYHEAQQVFYTETSQTDFYCDQAGEIVYKNEGTINQRLALDYYRTKNSYYDITVTLPTALVFDNSFSKIQQVRYVNPNGSVVYPYFIPSTNTWRFYAYQLENAFGKWIVKVKGAPASAGVCTGVHTYNFTLKTLLDSNNCNPSGNLSTLICNNTNFTYYGCVICCPLGGLAILNSSFQRTNYGFPDNNNDRQIDISGTVDTTLINRRIGISGDSLRLMIKALAVTNVTHSQWEKVAFGAILPGISSFTNFDYIKSSIKIRYASIGVDSVINISSYTILPNDTILFEIQPKRPLKQGDTVVFNGLFRDNLPRIGLVSLTIPAIYWASHVPFYNGGTLTNNNRFWCGNALNSYTHHTVYNNVTNAGLMQFTNCGQLISNTYLLDYVGNVEGPTPNIFRNEFRPILKPERFAIKFPTGYIIDSVNFNYNQAVLDKYIYSVPYTISNDSVIVNFAPYFNSGTLQMPDEASSTTIRVYLRPSCKIPTGIIQNTSLRYDARFIPKNLLINDYVATVGQLVYTAPSFLLNSPTPIYLGYTKTANWPYSITNASTQTVPNVWAYIPNNPNLPIDSLKFGSTIVTPDANGFYRLGTFTGNEVKNYQVFTKNLACNDDSLTVYMGYGCAGYPTSFTPTTCNFAPRKLYIQPQPAAIQTQITALATTPLDPANPSGGNFGSSSIYMCQGFPFEMELQATQPGNLYDVKETLTLPFNGGTGLDFISDSGYIEYPIGTTPRRFSATANSAILSQVPGGTMTLDLAQIDPANFGSGNALLGTGLGSNNTRRVILRWKMKSNCNLVNGDQWQATQLANSPCGSPAAGNSTVTSGYLLSLTGVTRPYVANLKVSTGLDGCGAQSTQIRIEKIGAGAPQPTDSITVRLPKTVVAGSVSCSGAACPVGAIVYTTRTDALYQYITFPYPSSAGSTGDTLLYSFPMRSRDKATCANNQTVKADVFQQLTIYCGSPIPANLCPNAKNSLGSETKSFDIRKAILSFDAYSSTYVYPSTYKYRFGGNVLNTSSYVATGAGVTLKTFMDVNNNLTYEKGIDALVRTTVLGSAIPTNGSVSFNDSFVNSSYSPSPSLPMYTVIDTGDASANCFCGGVVQSAFNQALPIEFINVNAINLKNMTGKVQWTTNADIHTIKFIIYRKSENDMYFTKIGEVMAQKVINGQAQYTYYDPISQLSEGRIYYQIEAVSENNINKTSKTVSINKTGIVNQTNLFTVSPNPSSQLVKINLTEGLIDGKITISDINGKIVFNVDFKGSETAINIANLAQGIYSISVESNLTIETQKLSIVR